MYPRPLSLFGQPFALPAAGELICWSRVLDADEALCIVNGHGTQARGGEVLVDVALSGPGAFGRGPSPPPPAFVVVANSAQAAHDAAAPGTPYTGSHPVGESVPVQMRNGAACVSMHDVPPLEIVVLMNRA
jgi:hypothetical protein